MFNDMENANTLNKHHDEPDLNDRADEDEEASPTLNANKEPLNITDMQDHFFEIMNSE